MPTATKMALSAAHYSVFVTLDGRHQRGKGHRRQCATTRAVHQRDRPAVLIDDLLDDREPEAGAGKATRLVRPVEPVKNERQRLVRDTGPAVGDGQSAVGGQLHVDVRP